MDFHNPNEKVKKIKRLIHSGKYDADIACFMSERLQLMYQGILDSINGIEQPAHISYKHLETFDLQFFLDQNLYINLNNLHLFFPLKFKKETNVALNLENDVITVNNFFAHWIKEINITKSGTTKSLILTSKPMKIYQYSDAMRKHLPEKALKIENDFLYSKKEVIFKSAIFDKRINTSNTPADITDPNLPQRIAKFAVQLQNEYIYRIPIRYLCNISKMNFPVKIGLKI